MLIGCGALVLKVSFQGLVFRAQGSGFVVWGVDRVSLARWGGYERPPSSVKGMQKRVKMLIYRSVLACFPFGLMPPRAASEQAIAFLQPAAGAPPYLQPFRGLGLPYYQNVAGAVCSLNRGMLASACSALGGRRLAF